MDSTSLLLHLLSRGFDVHGVSFDYGQKHLIELEHLQRNLEYLRDQGHGVHWHRVDLATLKPLLHSALIDQDWDVPTGHYAQENMKATVVPNRNAIFASIGYSWALSLSEQFQCEVSLGLGVHSGDHAIYPDCRPEFYDALFHAFKIGNWGSDRVKLYLPYLHDDKFGILNDAQRSAQELGLDFLRIFRNTITSYAPDQSGTSAGLTGSDVERILAFHRLGIPDPLPYLYPWEQVVRQALEFEQEQLG
jgi:7-cyano-7-deazaguanine synthase